MLLVRRLTALVTMLVTLVLVLTESGFACSTGEMAGMSMASMSGAQTPPVGDHGRAPEQAPCRFPWAAAGCRDMAPCAPAALAVASAPPAEPVPAREAVALARVSVPRSVETPPEPPPPRA